MALRSHGWYLIPFENNIITWSKEYGVYASFTEILSGASIQKVSAVNPATSGVCYPFETGSFDDPAGDAGKNMYGIDNQTAMQLTFGMAQSVKANGSKFDASPLNAVPVLGHQKATFKPIEKLQVFLHAHFARSHG